MNRKQNYPHVSARDSQIYRKQKHLMKVSGEGLVNAQPDMGEVTLGVVTENKDVSTAQSENTRVMSRIIQAILQMGIANEEIKTVDYRIDVQYENENGKIIRQGYKVTHLIKVIIKEINLTGNVIDVAVQNGANMIAYIQFTLAQPEVYYHQALSLALKDAQQKAATITKQLAISFYYIPVKITEISSAPSTSPFHVALFAKSEGTPIQTGQTQIKAMIEAEFVYFS
ncbi:SIMPL domain-containing protein [Heyndrickxia oleronia]|uniref:SIMPL domain-containing protein n=1 Tax=Heyndrickxia oleronia TaxID=38875 RepID=UPI00374FE69E